MGNLPTPTLSFFFVETAMGPVRLPPRYLPGVCALCCCCRRRDGLVGLAGATYIVMNEPLYLLTYPRKPNTENQRPLLPEMRPQAEHVPVQQRADLYDAVYREVHVGVEPGQLDLHQPATAGAINRSSFFFGLGGGSRPGEEAAWGGGGKGIVMIICTTGLGKCGRARER